MRWCDSNGVGYVLGLARNPVLERLAADWVGRAERQFQETGQPQRIFGSFAYKAGSWDRPRRVIVKAERTAQGPNPRFITVNVPGDPQGLYEHFYCQRGDMENRIKEQQMDLFADRTSCHRFLANQFRLLLSSAAYVLVQTLRRTALRGTDLEKAQVGTMVLSRQCLQSSTRSSISSELPLSSGAYIAWARAGRAWNRPGISARRRYETLCLPRASARAKKATRSSRNST